MSSYVLRHGHVFAVAGSEPELTRVPVTFHEPFSCTDNHNISIVHKIRRENQDQPLSRHALPRVFYCQVDRTRDIRTLAVHVTHGQGCPLVDSFRCTCEIDKVVRWAGCLRNLADSSLNLREAFFNTCLAVICVQHKTPVTKQQLDSAQKHLL